MSRAWRDGRWQWGLRWRSRPARCLTPAARRRRRPPRRQLVAGQGTPRTALGTLGVGVHAIAGQMFFGPLGSRLRDDDFLTVLLAGTDRISAIARSRHQAFAGRNRQHPRPRIAWLGHGFHHRQFRRRRAAFPFLGSGIRAGWPANRPCGQCGQQGGRLHGPDHGRVDQRATAGAGAGAGAGPRDAGPERRSACRGYGAGKGFGSLDRLRR